MKPKVTSTCSHSKAVRYNCVAMCMHTCMAIDIINSLSYLLDVLVAPLLAEVGAYRYPIICKL